MGVIRYTLPETNIFDPEHFGETNRNLLFKGSIFRCKLLVAGRVILRRDPSFSGEILPKHPQTISETATGSYRKTAGRGCGDL